MSAPRRHPDINKGDRFGRWEAVESSAPTPRPRHWTIKARCACGLVKQVAVQSLFNGRSTQCHACSRRGQWASWRRTQGRYWGVWLHDGYWRWEWYMPDGRRVAVPEHRIVMERKIGRELYEFETVHHINGARGDNRPENLQLRTGKHGSGSVVICHDCGSQNVGYAPIGEAA